jgi:hypothetical protein
MLAGSCVGGFEKTRYAWSVVKSAWFKVAIETET